LKIKEIVKQNIKNGRRGEYEQPFEWQGFALVAIGGVPWIPKEQVLPPRHRMQVRTSAGQCRGTEWKGDRLLRQH